MRRSAAPSYRADVKRARFLPQIISIGSLADKENQDYSESEIHISSTTKDREGSFNVSKLYFKRFVMIFIKVQISPDLLLHVVFPLFHVLNCSFKTINKQISFIFKLFSN